MNKHIAVILGTSILLIVMIIIMPLTGCTLSSEYTYKTEKVTGTVTKQYIVEDTHGRYAQTDVYYYTVVDYGGKNLKVIENYDYYIRHSVGDEVQLTKHHTYCDGKWVKCRVSY